MRGIESTANLGVARYLIFYLTPNSLGDTAPGTCQPWPFFELYIDFRIPKSNHKSQFSNNPIHMPTSDIAITSYHYSSSKMSL